MPFRPITEEEAAAPVTAGRFRPLTPEEIPPVRGTSYQFMRGMLQDLPAGAAGLGLLAARQIPGAEALISQMEDRDGPTLAQEVDTAARAPGRALMGGGDAPQGTAEQLAALGGSVIGPGMASGLARGTLRAASANVPGLVAGLGLGELAAGQIDEKEHPYWAMAARAVGNLGGPAAVTAVPRAARALPGLAESVSPVAAGNLRSAASVGHSSLEPAKEILRKGTKDATTFQLLQDDVAPGVNALARSHAKGSTGFASDVGVQRQAAAAAIAEDARLLPQGAERLSGTEGLVAEARTAARANVKSLYDAVDETKIGPISVDGLLTEARGQAGKGRFAQRSVPAQVIADIEAEIGANGTAVMSIRSLRDLVTELGNQIGMAKNASNNVLARNLTLLKNEAQQALEQARVMPGMSGALDAAQEVSKLDIANKAAREFGERFERNAASELALTADNPLKVINKILNDPEGATVEAARQTRLALTHASDPAAAEQAFRSAAILKLTNGIPLEEMTAANAKSAIAQITGKGAQTKVWRELLQDDYDRVKDLLHRRMVTGSTSIGTAAESNRTGSNVPELVNYLSRIGGTAGAVYSAAAGGDLAMLAAALAAPAAAKAGTAWHAAQQAQISRNLMDPKQMLAALEGLTPAQLKLLQQGSILSGAAPQLAPNLTSAFGAFGRERQR